MSKISRRNFIKGAGVAALAVAAAGMLAGCGSSAPEMVDVHVGYYCKDFLGNVQPIQDADKYAEVVPVAKGSNVKKSDLKNLQAACSGSTTYSAKDVPDEIDVDWETATAKVILSY
ncbi:MAG: twin-arginine translocation signal domain-containing protein [Faecalibacterium sp.]|nr:twin-arginine translocation signal domain-containing protein [Faecalibacterium sp.]MDD6630202.1 twin-arginine translocation signal domain-containing protein [Faecalibacterium sp.]MDD7170195.1 twin-arginine translocation signal domain-containing protein [Faecalibacterium sp.]MDY4157176.1 twin-arginine translocation signal domain-containing protein [Faecalibacterium sp.]MDY5503681.1 twin-arginine translocation signal domain-containing protein [Faecalibacterium sp.]